MNADSPPSEHRDCRILVWTAIAACVLTLGIGRPVSLEAAEDEAGEPADPFEDSAFELSEPRTYRLRMTFRVDANAQPLKNVTVSGPIPMNWREQRVKLLEERKPAGATTRVTRFPDQAAMLVIRFPSVPAGGFAAVEQDYEVTRYQVRFLGDPQSLKRPEKPSAALRGFLGSAPGIEVTDREVRKLADSLDKNEDDAWTNVRGIWKWVRGNVRYQQMQFQGAKFALRQKRGDCEDMTALFVALCRASGIPARTVWIEGHAYPEFYLENENGEGGKSRGHWIPAQLSGPAWFGRMAEYRPVLQKTDRLRDPIRRRFVRYVPQTARATGGVPRLSITRTMLADDPQTDATQARRSTP